MPTGEHLKGKGGLKFGEGQSTKKGGAPKGKRVSTIIKELLGKKASYFSKQDEYKDIDGNTALAAELIKMAFSDSDKSKDKLGAIKEILDRIEGKSVQTNIVETSEPLTGIIIKEVG